MEKPADNKRIHCRRTGQEYEVDVHERCPYCWGATEQVESGDHNNFCDFKPGEDPVHFGFPEDGNRLERG